MHRKPFSQACENNKDPILGVIKDLFADCKSVLEIGSGTGQHAVYFAEQLQHLTWFTSDRVENLAGIGMWLESAGLENLREPVALDVCQLVWPAIKVDAVYTANTVHIMHWHEVEALFEGVATLLPDGGVFVLYGPVNYQNQYTSDSNARFDVMLKTRDPESGIRNFEDLNRLADNAGLILKNDFDMPANNRIISWTKQHSV
jgi:cyclopropane fatty-acyl-phospholipid synthase-like methyltransferase